MQKINFAVSKLDQLLLFFLFCYFFKEVLYFFVKIFSCAIYRIFQKFQEVLYFSAQ